MKNSNVGINLRQREYSYAVGLVFVFETKTFIAMKNRDDGGKERKVRVSISLVCITLLQMNAIYKETRKYENTTIWINESID